MYNYVLTRLAYRPVFVILFISGICMGSVIALLFGILDRSIGIFGATFLAFLCGLFSGLIGLIYTAVFNTITPVIGGIPITIEPTVITVPDNRIIQPPDLPSY